MADLQTQVDLLRPAAIREQVREAGHEPDTPNGKRLVDFATKQSVDGRVPTVRQLIDQAAEWGLEVQIPPSDPATVEQQIAEARAEGDYATASKLQYLVDRERQRAESGQPTPEETKTLEAARGRAEATRQKVDAAETETGAIEARKEMSAAFSEASNLQLAIERRMKGVPEDGPEPHPVQPTSGLSQDQQALLEDEDKPLKDRLEAAQEAGDHVVASLLQTRLEREQATA